MTPGARADELGTAAAPWLAAGLAAPALAASGAIGRALVALAPFLLMLAQRPARAARGRRRRRPARCSARLVGPRHRARVPPIRWPRASGTSSAHASSSTASRGPGPFGSSAIARLDGHPVELRARGLLQQGTIVEVSGTLAPVPPSVGGFDRRTWLARQGVHETLAARSLAVLGRRGGVAGRRSTASAAAARAALAAGGDDESSRIATGVALGGTAALDDATVEDFRASGLAHLLAVSGGNVVLLVAAVLGLAWLAGVPRPLAHGCAIPAVSPTRRSSAAGRRSCARRRPASWHRSPGSSARRAIRGTCWRSRRRPCSRSIRGRSSARASSSRSSPSRPSTVSRRRIRSWLEGTAVPLRLCAPLAISLACTLATAPVALVHFGRTSLVASLPANLLALPAVAPLLWLALASCALWPVAPGAPRPSSTPPCARSAPTSGSSRTSARGSTARCRAVRC